MSHFSVQGEQSTSTEITALQNLTALATSGAGEFIRKTGATTFANATPSGGSGFVTGPVSSTDNAVVRFDGTGGATLQDSGILMDDSNVLYPATSDAGTLGSTTKMWSDLFLASGAVINFNNGDVTLTHSADILTLGGGNLALGANSLTMTGSLAATGARVTKGWFTDLESTNMPTVGGTVILSSLTAPQFTTIELGHASDTTLSRSSAGVLAVEGTTVSLNSTSATHTAGTIELGAASDTTIARVSAGVISVEGATVAMLSVAQSWTALQTYSMTSVPVRIVNTNDNASVQTLKLEGDRATMAANDEAYISLHLSDSAGNQDEMARITWKATTVTSTSEVSRLNFSVVAAGSLTDTLQLTSSILSPTTSDGVALGSTSLMWSDLFLASGAVLNFNNGDVTITHSADTLTLGGGNLALGANSLTMTGSIAATGARVTKGWFTDIESTNMPTVGGTVILTSLTAPQFTTIELGAASDTTLSRTGAGAIAVEGIGVALNSTSLTHTASTIELGHASDTTLARVSAGVVSIEGVNIVTVSSTDTLTNKTLTAAKIANAGFLADANGNELLIFTTTSSAVNEITFANAATGNNPSFTASGGDTDIGINLTAKGAGALTSTTKHKFSKNAYFAETDNGNSGTSKTIDWTASNKQKITTTGSCTLTFTAPSGPCNLLLKIVHEASASSYTYTWPATVKWPGATALTTTNTSGAVDIVSFYYDGTNYYAQGAANFS